MNIVTIDPSLISTALTINGMPFSIASSDIVYTKKGDLTKWFDICDDYCNIHPTDNPNDKSKSYANLELAKLESSQRIANLIRSLVDKHTDPTYNTLVLIEGYSYSSQAGPLIDLVTLSTLIRRNLFTRTDTELVVLSPSSVNSKKDCGIDMSMVLNKELVCGRRHGGVDRVFFERRIGGRAKRHDADMST